MHRKFIAAIAATSIALTTLFATSAPARADSEDIGRALAAIAGIAILGAIIKEARDDKRERVYGKTHKPVAPATKPRGHIKPRPLPKAVSRNLLPQRCLRSFRSKGTTLPGFGAVCLNQHYSHVRSLPQNCTRRVWSERGWTTIYGARCLRHNGYKLAGR